MSGTKLSVTHTLQQKTAFEDKGRWVKLGWAFNSTEVTPHLNPQLNDEFPEVVLRGAARLPKNTRHYGGYYTHTDENLPQRYADKDLMREIRALSSRGIL